MSAPESPRRGPLGALVRLFLTTHLSVIVLAASLIAGAVAVVVTPREEDPQIVVPVADVFVQVPGATPEEVERLAARPLENYLWQVDGVEYVYSQSMRGMAVVTVRFFVGEDRERSLVKLHNRITMHMDRVPPGVAGWVVKPREIDDVPVVTVALHSRELDPFALRRIGEEVLAGLEGLEDLSRTAVLGGLRRTVRVRPDAARLSGYGLTLLEVVGALQGADASLDAGAFAQLDRVHEVTAGPFLETADDLEQVVVGVHEGRPVRLVEVAEVTDGPEEATAYTRLGFGGASARAGEAPHHAVVLAVSKKRGTNAVRVAEEVLARVEEIRRDWLPEDVEVRVTKNSGATADAKVDELLGSLLFAIASVIVLISLTMGWREGLVVAAAVPVSFSLALLVNYLAGYSVNRVTLFALILSLGLVVDDPITNVDNIQRHLRLGRRRPDEATLDAVEEVLPPVIMSTLAIIVSFLPMSFITGMMGPYMGPMALNVPLAVSFSTLAALSFVPWLAYVLLRGSARQRGEGEEEVDPTPPVIRRVSGAVLRPFLASRRRALALLGCVAVLWAAAMSLPALRLVPLKMLPFDDKDEMQLVIDMPEGTTLERTDAVVRRFEELLRGREEVVSFESFVGRPSPLDFNGLIRHYDLREGPHLADLRVRLEPKGERARQSHTLALAMRPALEALAREAGARLKLVEVPPGPPVLSTVVAEVKGREDQPYAELLEAAEELMERMGREPGVTDRDHTGEAPRARLAFRLDKEKAALHGVDTRTVVRSLRVAVGGQEVMALHDAHERHPVAVEVRLDEPGRSGRARLEDVEVRGRAGSPVALGELGRFHEVPAEPSIMHKNLRRVVFVYAEMVGRAPGEAILDLQARLREEPLARDVEVEWAGEGEWRITLRVFRDLGIAFGVALIGIYLLLVVQTGSTTMPLVVMLAIPLMGLGVMPGFWILNQLVAETVGGHADLVFFTAPAMIGMIALGGIVVRNSIVLLEFVRDARAAGMDLDDALVDSVAVRFRPIVLTALTTGIGAAPITLDPIFSGLAWSLIFGLLASTLFTLVVVPVVLKLVEGGAAGRP